MAATGIVEVWYGKPNTWNKLKYNKTMVITLNMAATGMLKYDMGNLTHGIYWNIINNGDNSKNAQM